MREGKQKRIILASGSASRRSLLAGAGLTFDVVPSTVDEPAVRRAMEQDGRAIAPAEVAMALAEAKALDVSAAHGDGLVIGGDQVLALGDRLFEKPGDLVAARRQLQDLKGRQHALVSAVVIAEGGQILWGHADTANMTVRAFSEDFLNWYVETAGPVVCQSVGAYQLEGIGAQLFERVEGDYFTVLGLPLMPLLGELRRRGVLCQ
ncbi:MAG: Maf family protein [Hyphomicrobiaceae bacterium]